MLSSSQNDGEGLTDNMSRLFLFLKAQVGFEGSGWTQIISISSSQHVESENTELLYLQCSSSETQNGCRSLTHQSFAWI